MANTIKIKRKTTTGAPSAGQLEVGELCWNEVDNTMWIKETSGTIVQVNTGGVGGGLSFTQIRRMELLINN